jgi:hypothetical protein
MTLLRYDVWTTRIADGWSGCYSLPGRVCRVRDDLGFVRVFEDRQAAERAAHRALLDALNEPAGPVEGEARGVSRRSRWANAEAAEAAGRLFAGLGYGGSGGMANGRQRASLAGEAA